MVLIPAFLVKKKICKDGGVPKRDGGNPKQLNGNGNVGERKFVRFVEKNGGCKCGGSVSSSETIPTFVVKRTKCFQFQFQTSLYFFIFTFYF